MGEALPSTFDGNRSIIALSFFALSLQYAGESTFEFIMVNGKSNEDYMDEFDDSITELVLTRIEGGGLATHPLRELVLSYVNCSLNYLHSSVIEDRVNTICPLPSNGSGSGGGSGGGKSSIESSTSPIIESITPCISLKGSSYHKRRHILCCNLAKIYKGSLYISALLRLSDSSSWRANFKTVNVALEKIDQDWRELDRQLELLNECCVDMWHKRGVKGRNFPHGYDIEAAADLILKDRPDATGSRDRSWMDFPRIVDLDYKIYHDSIYSDSSYLPRAMQRHASQVSKISPTTSCGPKQLDSKLAATQKNNLRTMLLKSVRQIDEIRNLHGGVVTYLNSTASITLRSSSGAKGSSAFSLPQSSSFTLKLSTLPSPATSAVIWHLLESNVTFQGDGDDGGIHQYISNVCWSADKPLTSAKSAASDGKNESEAAVEESKRDGRVLDKGSLKDIYLSARLYLLSMHMIKLHSQAYLHARSVRDALRKQRSASSSSAGHSCYVTDIKWNDNGECSFTFSFWTVCNYFFSKRSGAVEADSGVHFEPPSNGKKIESNHADAADGKKPKNEKFEATLPTQTPISLTVSLSKVNSITLSIPSCPSSSLSSYVFGRKSETFADILDSAKTWLNNQRMKNFIKVLNDDDADVSSGSGKDSSVAVELRSDGQPGYSSICDSLLVTKMFSSTSYMSDKAYSLVSLTICKSSGSFIFENDCGHASVGGDSEVAALRTKYKKASLLNSLTQLLYYVPLHPSSPLTPSSAQSESEVILREKVSKLKAEVNSAVESYVASVLSNSACNSAAKIATGVAPVYKPQEDAWHASAAAASEGVSGVDVKLKYDESCDSFKAEIRGTPFTVDKPCERDRKRMRTSNSNTKRDFIELVSDISLCLSEGIRDCA